MTSVLTTLEALYLYSILFERKNVHVVSLKKRHQTFAERAIVTFLIEIKSKNYKIAQVSNKFSLDILSYYPHLIDMPNSNKARSFRIYENHHVVRNVSSSLLSVEVIEN